jgi:hypothetical protein
VAKAILLRVLLAAALVVPGWIMMAYLSAGGGGGGTPPPGSRGAQTAELQSIAALVQASQVLSDHRAASGTFAGADLSTVPGTRLVRADAATFCVEAGESSWVNHLDGTTQEVNSWAAAVKGACS